MIFCFFQDEMSQFQFYIGQLELIGLLFKFSILSTFWFRKQIILCFSACFQEFATIFIDTFSYVCLLLRRTVALVKVIYRTSQCFVSDIKRI